MRRRDVSPDLDARAGAARRAIPPGARPARSRAVLVLLLLVIVGLPLAITGSLFVARDSMPATVGDQPGGPIEGRLRDPEGVPLSGVRVQLFLVDEGGGVDPCSETLSGADGRFHFEAPAHRGKYALRAGGDAWVVDGREFSFLDREGKPIEPRDLQWRLEPGCRLAIELIRATDRYDDSGHYELRGRLHRGIAFGLVRPELRLPGEFEGGRIDVGGLPPLAGSLTIFLDNGDEVELELDLVPGVVRRELEL